MTAERKMHFAKFSRCMKFLPGLILLFSMAARADETADRAAIAKVIAALNDGKPRPELQYDLLPAGAMSGGTPPRISTRPLPFIPSPVALMDPGNNPYRFGR